MSNFKFQKYVFPGCLFLVALCAAPVSLGADVYVPDEKNIQTRFSWTDYTRYTGNADSETVTRTDLKQLMYEFQKEQISTAKLSKDPALLNKATTSGAYSRLSIPRNNTFGLVEFSLLHWEKTPAEQTAVEAQQTDPAVTLITVFIAAPVKDVTYRGSSLHFVISGNDFFEKADLSGNKIRNLRINPGDQSGWRNIWIDQEIPVSYKTTGDKTVTMEAELDDGTLLIANSIIDVRTLETPVYDSLIPVGGYYNDVFYSGKMYEYKAPGHTALHTPVLVVEGFDLDNSMDWDVLYNILNKQQLAENLRSFGRDLLVLDFDDATADIFGNTMAAMDAINQINSLRADLNDKFTVVGASMGGLVSRTALINFEQNPGLYGDHNVDTWISFDSPHRGANIPLGLQEFLYFFHDKNETFAEAAELLATLNRPAAKQLLLIHYSTSGDLAGNAEQNSFQAQMDILGYPSQCKTIAISNGSGYGETQPFNAGDQIINWSYTAFLSVFDIDADIYAINTYQTTTPTVFHGYWMTLLPYETLTTTVRQYYPYSIDNAAGGQRNTFQQLFDVIPAEYKDGGDYCIASNHCFIPVTSSLGIDLSYNDSSLDDNPSITALSPFDEIHYALENEDHIDINARNEYWFLRGILEDYDSDNDGLDDYAEYCTRTDYLNPTSRLSVAVSSISIPPGGQTELQWNNTTNTTYAVYCCTELGLEWQPVEETSYSLTPSNTCFISLTPTNNSCFYKIIASPIDPAN